MKRVFAMVLILMTAAACCAAAMAEVIVDTAREAEQLLQGSWVLFMGGDKSFLGPSFVYNGSTMKHGGMICVVSNGNVPCVCAGERMYPLYFSADRQVVTFADNYNSYIMYTRAPQTDDSGVVGMWAFSTEYNNQYFVTLFEGGEAAVCYNNRAVNGAWSLADGQIAITYGMGYDQETINGTFDGETFELEISYDVLEGRRVSEYVPYE